MTCSRNTGVDCDPQKKPLAVTTCHVVDCPQVVDNFGGIDWSGSGWSSKEVLNEINSIPEVKPPPKYSTTRAQPRSHNNNNLNNIVEGDFHYHNNIENINQPPENSVQVDDFYYDYNFINFHEDLSDDFESDGKDSEDRFSTPQEAEPTGTVGEKAYMETTGAPSAISTISKATVYTLKTEVPQNTNQDNTKDSGNAATKESMQTNSENLDDLLSEDYLLPVSTTRSPPLSPSHLQTLREETHDEDVWWPENTSTMPSLGFTTEEPRQDVEWERYGEEAENNYNIFTQDVTATPEQAAPTPGHQTNITTIVPRTVSAQETEERDDYEYSYSEKSTLGPDISADQEDVESPEPVGSPTPETIIQVKTEVQLDEIPQTTSHTTIFTTAFTLEYLDLDQANSETVYASSEGNSWDLDLTTSLSASETPTPLPVPFLLISGNQKASEDLTGTEIIPPTNLEGATQPPPADSLPATVKQIPTKPAFAERTGTDSTSQAPLTDSAHFDYNEIVVPPMLRSNTDPGPSYQPPTTTAQQSTTPVQHMESPTPAGLILPTHPQILWPLPVPTSAPTSASTQVTTAAYWVTGNWSAVSLHTFWCCTDLLKQYYLRVCALTSLLARQ